MSVLACQQKQGTLFDKYATAKSNGQLFLSGGLLADTVKDLYLLTLSRDDMDGALWTMLLGLMIASLVLELLGMGLSLYLSLQKYPCILPDGNVQTAPTQTCPSDGTCPKAAKYAADGEGDVANLPRCPKHMKVLNDTLTVVTFILLALHAVKNALHGAAQVREKDLS